MLQELLRLAPEDPCSAEYGRLPSHDTPYEVPEGRVVTPMPGNTKALAKAYVAIKHVLGTVSSMQAKWNKDELIVKLWVAQCTE